MFEFIKEDHLKRFVLLRLRDGKSNPHWAQLINNNNKKNLVVASLRPVELCSSAISNYFIFIITTIFGKAFNINVIAFNLKQDLYIWKKS